MKYPVECPFCGLTFEDNAEWVDVGFGSRGVQVTGNVCEACNATERGQNPKRSQIDEVVGWYAPVPNAVDIGFDLDKVLENVFAMGVRHGCHWAPAPDDAPDLAPVLGGGA